MSQSKEQHMQLREEGAESENIFERKLRQMKEKQLTQQQTTSPSATIASAIKSILSLDAATIDTLARAIVQEVQDGNKDALETLIIAKKGAALFKAIDDNVKSFAYGKQYATKGENVVRNGCKVEPSELGVSYDYYASQDPIYEQISEEFGKVKQIKEDREKFLKSIKDKMTIVSEDTGDIVTIYAPVKKGTLGYKISIL